MDIVSRLKAFLEQNKISNSVFADNCGIPRPTLSQLLNGRNKKVSDELIAKIHTAYPQLSITWLMFGEGTMIDFGPNAKSAANSRESKPFENYVEQTATGSSAKKTTIDFGSDEENTQSPELPLFGPSDEAQPSASKVNADFARALADPSKTIEKIIIFYSDKSFDQFTPNS